MTWIVVQSGVPIAAHFGNLRGQGSPIIVDEATGTAYFITSAGVVTPILGTTSKLESVIIACSDETSTLTTGTAKRTFRMPYAFYLTAVRASLKTAQTSGTAFQVDINEAGTSVLSTKLTIDNSELTSVTAATAAVISDPSLASDAEITIDIDTCTASQSVGLKVTLIGYQV